VTAAAAVARPDGTGELRLIGYAVPRRAGVAVQSLRDLLAQRLPEYARPAAVLLLPGLPLTANGKLDRAALPDPPAQRPTAEPAAEPATATERLVAGVWREVLGLPRVGATDNFFEIGGHSLSIVAVHARLAGQVRPELQLVDLFRYPTVRALAGHLDGTAPPPGLDRAARRVAARRARPPRPSTSDHHDAQPQEDSHERACERINDTAR
jgi:hypothetical protein